MKFIVLPFECSTTNINGDVYLFDSVKANMVNFTSVNGVMSANTPYLVYSETGGNIIEGLQNVNIKATPNSMSITRDNAQLVATYKTTTNDNAFEYVEGGFERLNGEWLPFETLLKFNSETLYDRYIISFNGEATGIEISTDQTNLFPADVYDLSGKLILRNVESLEGLTKGVYIVKGKKVVSF
jgi:hypothetical protein